MSNYDNLTEAIKFIEERRNLIDYLRQNNFISPATYQKMIFSTDKQDPNSLRNLQMMKREIDNDGGEKWRKGITKDRLKEIKDFYNRNNLATLFKKKVNPFKVQVMGQQVQLSNDSMSLRQTLNFYRNLAKDLLTIDDENHARNFKNSMSASNLTVIKAVLNTAGLTLEDMADLSIEQLMDLEKRRVQTVVGKYKPMLEAIQGYARSAIGSAHYANTRAAGIAGNKLHIQTLKNHGWTNKDIKILASYIDASSFWKAIHKHNLSSEQHLQDGRVLNAGMHEIADFLDRLLAVIRTEDADLIDDFIRNELRN